MSKHAKIKDRILSGSSDANVGFDDMCAMLRRMGFRERIRGSHHIFTRDGIAEIINLQPIGGKAKVYQVKQVRDLLENHSL